MIQQQTFDVRATEDELAVIANVLELLTLYRYEEAKRVLILRQDKLQAEPVLHPYDPREQRV